MSSREKILEAVLKNQPEVTLLPDVSTFKTNGYDVIKKYIEVFESGGGSAYLVNGLDEVKAILREKIDFKKRIISNLSELEGEVEIFSMEADPHSFEDVELAIIRGHFSVAENGAVWITENLMGERIIPYICQHLAVIINGNTIVPTLHEAYENIGKGDYGFGGFIAGPSKTADIEQALVLGAHGPLSMTVFILTENE